MRVIRRQRRVHAHMRRLRLRQEKIEQFLHHAVKRNNLRAQFDPTGKAQEIIERLAQAVGLFFECRQADAGALSRVAGQRSEFLLEQLQIQFQRGEGIPQFMRQARRKISHAGKLFEPLFAFLLLQRGLGRSPGLRGGGKGRVISGLVHAVSRESPREA